MNEVLTLKNRLSKLGITIELVGNFPWIYLDKVNNLRVRELFQSEHGFVIGFSSLKENNSSKVTDLKQVLSTIRKYVRTGNNI